MIIKLKITLLFILLMSINSCNVTSAVWEKHPSSDNIDGFFLDDEEKRVVLIGSYDYMLDGKDYFHYSITDSENEIYKIVNLGVKSGTEVEIYIGFASASGKKFGGSFSISFQKGELGKEDWEFLSKFSGLKGESREKYFSTIKDIHTKLDQEKGVVIRYPKSQERQLNFCDQEFTLKNGKFQNGKEILTMNYKNLNKDKKVDPNKPCTKVMALEHTWRGKITEYPTSKDILKSLALTPFAMAADIIILPFYIIVGVASAFTYAGG